MACRSRCSVFVAALGAISALLCADPAAGAPSAISLSAAASPTRVATVPVRARRLPDFEPEHETGAAVTVLEGPALRARHGDLAEALDRQAGLQVQRSGGFGAVTHLRVRGSTLEQVRYALDDVPLQALDGAPMDLAELPLSQLERAEIYRGATPLALGGQAIGGAVRLLLRRPERPGATLRLGGGSQGSMVAEGSAAWLAAGGHGTAALRWLRSDGDHGYTFDGGTAFDTDDDRWRLRRNNQIQRFGGLLRQSARVGRRLRVEARYLGAWRRQGLPGVALYEAEEAGLSQDRHDLVVDLRGRDVGLPGAELRAHVQAARRRTEVDDGLGELGMPQHSEQTIDGLATAWRWLGPAWGPARLEVRASAEQGRVNLRDLRVDTKAPTSTRTGLGAGLGLPLRWARPEISLLPNLSVERMQSERSWLPVESDGWQRLGVPARNLLTGRLAASWQATPTLQVHGGWTRSARPPTLLELFGNDGTVLGNHGLGDEAAQGIDLAVTLRGKLGTTEVRVQAGGFAMAIADLIGLRRVSAHQARYENLAAATLVGAELETSATLADRLDLSGRATALLPRDDSTAPEYAGRDLPMRSRWRLDLRAGLKGQPWRHLGRVDGWLAWRWQAPHFTDRSNRIEVPARSSLDAGVAVAAVSDRLRLTVRLANLIDQANFDLIGYPLPGRTALLTLDWGSSP